MPVPKAAINKYLDRQVETLAWFKKLKPLEVEEELSYINPPPRFTIPTFRLDQKICFLLGLTYPEVLFMTDLGMGKTGLSLELLSYFYWNDFIRRAVVFAPTNEVAEGWEDEIKLWGFDIPYVRLEGGSSANKWDKLIGFKDGLIIGTYVGIAAMVSELRLMVDNKGKPLVDKNGVPTGKQHRVVQGRKLLKLLKDVDAVVYDQSTKLGNNNSLSFEVCNEFSRDAQIRYGLAGRAFGRDPFILWSQLYLVDRGKAVGTSAGMFREAFFRRQEHGWGTKWIFRKRREKHLSRFLASSSIRYSVDECMDLPPKINIIKECTFPDENWEYFDQIKDELLSSRGNYREVQNAFLRMRQISSGFIGFHDDETGEKAQVEFQLNPKMDLLEEYVDEVPEDRKFIIVHEFNWSGSKICQMLAKKKIKYGWLWGGTKNWTFIKESFRDDPDFRCIVMNWKKGSMGLNLQTGSYEFMYESPVSPIDRYEVEGRIYRNGQKHKSLIYDLVVKDSVDEKILEFQKEGADLFKALVDRPEKLFKSGRR